MTKTSRIALALAALGTTALPAVAQVEVRDLVVTAGAALEGYRGNMSSVTIPVVDSTNRASAAVAEFGARGRVFFLNNPERGFRIDFDGGLRQFAASGFEVAKRTSLETVRRPEVLGPQVAGQLPNVVEG